jgi:23S rRNA (uracil1939-C5)-methyltransferase
MPSKPIGLGAELLNQIIGAICRHANVKRIILYGSRARGDYGRGSDIDIAVECEDDNGFVRNVIDDEVRTLLKLDIVNLDGVNEKLRHEIDEDGIVVYEKA